MARYLTPQPDDDDDEEEEEEEEKKKRSCEISGDDSN